MPDMTHQQSIYQQWLKIPAGLYLDGREVEPREYHADGTVTLKFMDNGQIVRVSMSEVYTK